MHTRRAALCCQEDRVGSSDRVEGTRGTSSALETTEKVAGTAPVVPAGLSTATLPPEDGTEAIAPLPWMMLGLSPHMGLREWTLLSDFCLRMVQGSLVVLAP